MAMVSVTRAYLIYIRCWCGIVMVYLEIVSGERYKSVSSRIKLSVSMGVGFIPSVTWVDLI